MVLIFVSPICDAFDHPNGKFNLVKGAAADNIFYRAVKLSLTYRTPFLLISDSSSLVIAIEIHEKDLEIFRQIEVHRSSGVRYGADVIKSRSSKYQCCGISIPVYV